MMYQMNDKRDYIMKNIEEKYNYLQNLGYKVIAIYLQGSQNYGLDVYDDDYKSDIDAKAIVIPKLEDIILNKKPVSTTIVMDNNEHIDVKDIRVMKDMFIKQNLSYLELLYTDYYKYDSEFEEELEELKSIRNLVSDINRNQLFRCIKGMSMEKLKALEHPYPNLLDKIEKFGYDPKQLHHILRLNEFITRYVLGESLESCYKTYNPIKLIEVKKGCYSLNKARQLAVEYDADTKNICDNCITDNEIVNYETIEKLNNIITKILKKSFKEELRKE